MSPLVVDASVAVKCILPEPGSSAAASLVDDARLLLVPDIVYAECANAIWKGVRRGASSEHTARVALADLMSMSFLTLASESLTPSALSIALTHNHPVYDCYYIAAAIQSDADLATADERLYDLALRVGLGERAILVR